MRARPTAQFPGLRRPLEPSSERNGTGASPRTADPAPLRETRHPQTRRRTFETHLRHPQHLAVKDKTRVLCRADQEALLRRFLRSLRCRRQTPVFLLQEYTIRLIASENETLQNSRRAGVPEREGTKQPCRQAARFPDPTGFPGPRCARSPSRDRSVRIFERCRLRPNRCHRFGWSPSRDRRSRP